MDETAKHTCLKELGFQIFDQDEKVTAIQLSNNWSVKLVDAIAVLEEFATKNEHEALFKEYLIRGAAKDRRIITVIPETKLMAYEKKLERFSKTLFGVSKKFPSNKTIHYQLEPTKVINLRMPVGEPKKPREVHIIPEPRPCMEKKKKNIFAMPENKKGKTESASSSSTKKSTEAKDKEVTPKKDNSPVEKGKSPIKKSAEKQAKGGKQVPKAQMGKGSIASFFGQKPAATNGSTSSQSAKTPPTPKQEEKKTIKVEPETPTPAKKTPPVEVVEDSSRKRNHSSDRGSGSDKKIKAVEVKQPSTKKAKKEVKTKKVEKRSRIMAICDSESSDEGGASDKNKSKSQVNSEEEEVEDEPAKRKKETGQSVEVKKESPDENRNPAKKRKAIRKVNKSYQDADGFIRTVRETEEYSCSDDDVVEVVKEKAVPGKSSSTAASKPASSTLKPKIPSKQGSIMSFFGKK